VTKLGEGPLIRNELVQVADEISSISRGSPGTPASSSPSQCRRGRLEGSTRPGPSKALCPSGRALSPLVPAWCSPLRDLPMGHYPATLLSA
jgi:hypothetical protein